MMMIDDDSTTIRKAAGVTIEGRLTMFKHAAAIDASWLSVTWLEVDNSYTLVC